MFATSFLGLHFAELPPGRFLMGSPESEIGRESDERQHEVNLTRPFRISTSLVTNRQFRLWQPSRPPVSYRDHALDLDDLPVVSVSLAEATAFATWLTDKDPEWHYMLPSEAEWEYAARAGSNSRFFWGDDESLAGGFANLYDRSARQAFPDLPEDAFDVDDGFPTASPAGRFRPNAFGLYDTLGNVWEMCRNRAYKYPVGPVSDPQGAASGSLYIARGGDWLSMPFFARLANRTFVRIDDRDFSTGFRLAAYPKAVADPSRSQPSPMSPLAPAVTWSDVRGFFTADDIEHMRTVSERWTPSLDLAAYQSARYYAVKIYSSVRDDSMPIGTVPKWTPAMKRTFRDWIYGGCTE